MKRIMEWVKEHKYCYSFLYLILYLLAFFLMEQISEPQYLIHSNLDDKIPFNSYFLIFYVSWYIAFVGSLIFFMFYDKKDYQDLSFIMMNGTTLIFIIYFLFPNYTDLRFDLVPRNIFDQIVNLLWGIDTPTNVCPSLHVSISTAVMVAVWNSKKLKKNHPVWRILIIVWQILICASTVFLKQHSIIDVFAGCLVTLLFSVICYKVNWRKILGKTIFRSLL
ncbi:pAP2 superfamily [Firmicutes bacterium CAG:308]|nr:pAP2 superfamily [Firmicutes bacterium CAG:308]